VFDWDEANVTHLLTRHGVSPEEAEETFADPRRQTISAYNVPAERRRGLLGATGGGRVLVLIYTIREDSVRIITARDADGAEKRRYRRRK